MFNSLSEFYTSDAWSSFRRSLILDRGPVCEHCGQDILRPYEVICHHVTPLTEDNVNDYNISLNPENIVIVHHRCHNIIHERFGTFTRHIYLVYGPPGSGKSTFVRETAGPNDLVIDMDNIFEMISINSRYTKPNTLSSVAFGVRDSLMDMVKVRRGRWTNAFIVGGFPRRTDRENIVRIYGAEEVFIDASRDECMSRTMDRPGWSDHIDRWFGEFTPSD